MTARLLTGSTYAVLGYDAIRAPGARVAQAAPTLALLRRVLPLPSDDTLVVRANAAVQAAAGAMLMLDRCPRIASAALIASLVPTTAAGHDFWNHDDPATRKQQRVQFQKNLAMIGGLIHAISDFTPTSRSTPQDRQRPTLGDRRISGGRVLGRRA